MRLALLMVVATLIGCAQPVQTEVVEIERENEPPVVTLSAPESLENGEGATVSAIVTDPDDDTHAYLWTVSGSPAGYAPEISFSRSPDSERDYTITVTVSDGREEATAECTVTVASPPWQPETLHVYTFGEAVTEYEESLIRDEWEFTEDEYTEMVSRIEATVESHNLNHPDDRLQVVEGGTS